MSNNLYNSLTEKLISDGIISSEKNNIFENPIPVIEKNIEPVKNKNKKRINNYDFEFVNNSNDEIIHDVINFRTIVLFSILKKFLNKNNKFENLFFKLFPKLHKTKRIKEALSKLEELNIDVKALLDKAIPYKEAEIHYEDLIKYLNYASEVQACLKKKR